mmetsp:Transcript_29526/g.26113  ORF Transcript_29526/g.26113 Transcript_29526/m.26113 type:complete len:89 (+) Transcript_29526:556-822(+)
MVFNENDESIFNQEVKETDSKTTQNEADLSEHRDSMISFNKEYRNNRFTIEQTFQKDENLRLTQNNYFKNNSKKTKSKRRSRDERNKK